MIAGKLTLMKSSVKSFWYSDEAHVSNINIFRNFIQSININYFSNAFVKLQVWQNVQVMVTAINRKLFQSHQTKPNIVSLKLTLQNNLTSNIIDNLCLILDIVDCHINQSINFL